MVIALYCEKYFLRLSTGAITSGAFSYLGAVMERDKQGRFVKGHNGLKMEKNPTWKGGRIIDKGSGYVRIAIGGKRYKTEHRIIMEQHLVRKLKPDEDIHHIDGNRQNNKIDNLQLMSKSDHTSLHHKGSTKPKPYKCKVCGVLTASKKHKMCRKHYKQWWQKQNGSYKKFM